MHHFFIGNSKLMFSCIHYYCSFQYGQTFLASVFFYLEIYELFIALYFVKLYSIVQCSKICAMDFFYFMFVFRVMYTCLLYVTDILFMVVFLYYSSFYHAFLCANRVLLVFFFFCSLSIAQNLRASFLNPIKRVWRSSKSSLPKSIR